METTNKLEFEVAPHLGVNDPTKQWVKYKVGTCHGLWRSKESAYEILAIINEEPHNGHFNDVFEWFEHSCERDNKNLLIRQVWNRPLKQHLIEKRGFKEVDVDSFNVIKYFKNESIIS